MTTTKNQCDGSSSDESGLLDRKRDSAAYYPLKDLSKIIFNMFFKGTMDFKLYSSLTFVI